MLAGAVVGTGATEGDEETGASVSGAWVALVSEALVSGASVSVGALVSVVFAVHSLSSHSVTVTRVVESAVSVAVASSKGQ